MPTFESAQAAAYGSAPGGMPGYPPQPGGPGQMGFGGVSKACMSRVDLFAVLRGQTLYIGLR